jgi:hypothetical protein
MTPNAPMPGIGDLQLLFPGHAYSWWYGCKI